MTTRLTIITGRTELKRGCKCQVFFLCGRQIYALNGLSLRSKRDRRVISPLSGELRKNRVTNLENAWICRDCLHLDGVD